MKSTYILLFILLVSVKSAQTQSPFKAGTTIGLNMAQIDGDKQFGYAKKGLNLGLQGGIVVNKHWSFWTELLYNFKGCQPSSQEKNSDTRNITMDLHYAEIPLLAKFNFIRSEEGYYLWQIYGGISYGRLLSSKLSVLKKDGSSDILESNLINQIGFKSSEINLIVGASRRFSSRLGISLKHTVALTPFYNNPTALTNPSSQDLGSYEKFRNYFLSAGIFYDFVQ